MKKIITLTAAWALSSMALFDGCSPRSGQKEGPNKLSQAQGTNNSESNAAAPQIPQPVFQSTSNRANMMDISLTEMRVDIVDMMAFSEMIDRHPEVRAELEVARDIPNTGNISEQDLETVNVLVSRINGFLPSQWPGHIFKYPRFTAAVVPGAIGLTNFNAYLIRVPPGKWFLLETKEMP